MAIAAVVIVVLFIDGVSSGDVTAVVVIALVMSLIWAVMLRPSLIHRGDDLVLRQTFSDVVIPLANVKKVTIRQFMAVTTTGRTYHSSVLTRSRRQVANRDGGRITPDPIKDYTDLVEQQINQLAEDASAKRLPEGRVVRRLAWPEIGLVAVLALASIVLLVV